MILGYFRNVIGILIALFGIYLTINAYYGSWGIVFFVIGIYMIKRIEKNERK